MWGPGRATHAQQAEPPPSLDITGRPPASPIYCLPDRRRQRSLLTCTYTSHNINLVQGANRPQSNPPISQPANQSITSTKELPLGIFRAAYVHGNREGVEWGRGRGRLVSHAVRASHRNSRKAPHPKGSSRLLLRGLPAPRGSCGGFCAVILTQRGANRSGEGWLSVRSLDGGTRWLFDVVRRGGVVWCCALLCCVVWYVCAAMAWAAGPGRFPSRLSSI